MLRLTGKHPVLEHLAAFTIAWVAAAFLFVYVLRPLTVPQPNSGYHIDTLGKGETAARNLIYISNALREGKTITVLGSSELDRLLWNPYTPNLFFPHHNLGPVLTYGRANLETLGIYGLLYGVRPHLNARSRLVILLSPAWFRIGDIATAAFDANFDDNVLLQLYGSDEPRSIFHDYLTSHQFEFTDMTTIERMYLDDPEDILDWNLPGFLGRTINARAYAQREKLNLWLANLSERPQLEVHTDAAGLPWPKYRQQARDAELSQMTNNTLWVRNRYYRLYSSTGKARSRLYFPKHMDPEPEMAALRDLLQLLHRSKVNALFIMQPINPKLYDDVSRFDAVDARVTTLCAEYGMGYFDMYQQPYEEGVLRDNQHPGELGWEEIDERIAGFFHL